MESKVLFEKKQMSDTYKGVKKESGGIYQGRNSLSSNKVKFTGECEGLKECVFDCSDGRQARNFDKNTKRLSIYAAGKYERGAEITTLIDELVEVEINKPTFYTGSDPGEQRINDIRFNQYVINQEKLETEIKKLYSLVLGQCTEQMISKLKTLDTYKDMHIKKDALNLLKAIKDFTFMFDGEYEMSLAEAIDRFYRIYQGKDMSNLEYRNLFDNGLEVIEHFGGSIGIHKHVTEKVLAETLSTQLKESSETEKYTSTQYQESAKKGQERMLARMFLLKCDKERYTTMLNKLANDHISGRNAYPETRHAAYTLLNNWILDRKPSSSHYLTLSQHGSSFNQESGRNTAQISCWGCGKEGVLLSNCTNNECKLKQKARDMKKNLQQGIQYLNKGSFQIVQVPANGTVMIQRSNSVTKHITVCRLHPAST